MNCRQLEDRLEALLDGSLDAAERERCERHLDRCPECRELAAPAMVPPPADLLTAVLEHTAGSACGRARELLSARLDGALADVEHRLLGPHLERCAGCRAIDRTLARLAAELPRLAELRPPAGFADAVLAATLPASVRLRRWWNASWPRWVQRPRFASEAACIGTLVLVLVVATPGSPLEAVPRTALELARTDPAARVEAPVAALEERFSERLRAIRESRVDPAVAAARSRAAVAARDGQQLVAAARSQLGTLRDGAASLLTKAGVALRIIDPPAPETAESDQETS